MRLSALFGWLNRRDRRVEAKLNSDNTDEILDVAVAETRAAAGHVIRKSRQEIKHSQQVILVANQALRSLRSR